MIWTPSVGSLEDFCGDRGRRSFNVNGCCAERLNGGNDPLGGVVDGGVVISGGVVVSSLSAREEDGG